MQDKLILALLHKQLTGQLESTDKQILIDWLVSSDENKEVQNEIAQIWELSKNYEPKFQPNVDAAYEKFSKRIRSDQKVTKPATEAKRIRLFRPWMRYAAAAVIVFGSVLIWQFYRMSAVDTLMVSTINNEIQEVQLADGTSVWLNEKSTLNYPDKFRKGERVVELQGEAFFNVEADPQKPFIIKGGAADVKVLGTSFSLNTAKGEQFLEVEVKQGTVQIIPVGSSESLVLTENERVQYDLLDKKFLPKELLKVSNADYFVSNSYSFIDSKYTYVFEILSEVYDVNFRFKDESLKNCTFTSPIEFNRENINAAIEVIEYAYKHRNLKIEKISETLFEISGDGCTE